MRSDCPANGFIFGVGSYPKMLVESTSESINQGFYSAQMDRNAVNH